MPRARKHLNLLMIPTPQKNWGGIAAPQGGTGGAAAHQAQILTEDGAKILTTEDGKPIITEQ
jgi:hypothetical protein